MVCYINLENYRVFDIYTNILIKKNNNILLYQYITCAND